MVFIFKTRDYDSEGNLQDEPIECVLQSNCYTKLAEIDELRQTFAKQKRIRLFNVNDYEFCEWLVEKNGFQNLAFVVKHGL